MPAYCEGCNNSAYQLKVALVAKTKITINCRICIFACVKLCHFAFQGSVNSKYFLPDISQRVRLRIRERDSTSRGSPLHTRCTFLHNSQQVFLLNCCVTVVYSHSEPFFFHQNQFHIIHFDLTTPLCLLRLSLFPRLCV